MSNLRAAVLEHERVETRPRSAPNGSRTRRAQSTCIGLCAILTLAAILGGFLVGCAADAAAGVPTAVVAASGGAIAGPTTASSTADETVPKLVPSATATSASPTGTVPATASATTTASATESPIAAPIATATTAPTTTAPPPTVAATATPAASATPAPRASATSTPTLAPTFSATPSPRQGTATPTAIRPTVAAEANAFTADVGLDPGHHRLDVGATGGGLREYEVTLDLALRAKRRLEAAGLRVALSRTDHNPVATATSGDATEQIRLEQEARIRAVGNSRVFVSIHLNAFGDPSLGGTETYYNPDAAGGEGRRLATALQSGILRRLAEAGYASSNRGAKSDLSDGKPYGHFFSLRGPMPSALVESLFLSNPAEAALLGRDDVREGIARGIADGVLAFLGR